MKINELLKNYETLCVSFSEEEKPEFSKMLVSLGFYVPENFCSPAIIHRDKRVSFITGFVSGIYFSQPSWKLKKHGVLKIDFCDITPSEEKSGWYDSRNRAILDLRRN